MKKATKRNVRVCGISFSVQDGMMRAYYKLSDFQTAKLTSHNAEIEIGEKAPIWAFLDYVKANHPKFALSVDYCAIPSIKSNVPVGIDTRSDDCDHTVNAYLAE